MDINCDFNDMKNRILDGLKSKLCDTGYSIKGPYKGASGLKDPVLFVLDNSKLPFISIRAEGNNSVMLSLVGFFSKQGSEHISIKDAFLKNVISCIGKLSDRKGVVSVLNSEVEGGALYYLEGSEMDDPVEPKVHRINVEPEFSLEKQYSQKYASSSQREKVTPSVSSSWQEASYYLEEPEIKERVEPKVYRKEKDPKFRLEEVYGRKGFYLE